MTIKVLLFGQVSELTTRTEMAFSDIQTTEELNRELLKQFPKLRELKFAIAVNKKVVNQNTVLKDKDVIALLPAFSGG